MLDMRTSLYFLGFASTVFGLLLSLTAEKRETRGITSFLIWAKLLEGTAFFLLAARGEIPDVLSKNVGNSFLFTGFALEGIAAWIFMGRHQWKGIVFPVLAGGILSMNVFIMTGASGAVLVAAASFIVAILMIICSSAFLFWPRDRSFLMLTIGLIDAAVAIINIVRGMIALLVSPDLSLLSPGLVQSLAIISFTFFVFTNGFGFLLLIKEDDDRLLKEGEDKYRRLFETLLDIYYRVDSDGKFVMVSPSIKMIGYLPEEVLGRYAIDFYVHREERKRFLKILMKDGFVNDFEVQVKRKDGAPQWVSFNARIDKDGEGKSLGIDGFVRDISKRKRADDALRREYAFRSAILENLAEGFCVSQRTAEYPFIKFTLWNDRMTQITGYTLEEINRLGWYQTLYPDPDMQARAQECISGMLEGEDLHAKEWVITHAGGDKRVLSISTSVMESDDGLAHVLALINDITERKTAEAALLESENKFRGFAEQALTGEYLIQDGTFQYINPKFAEIFGYSVEECLHDMPFGNLVYAEDLPVVEEQIAKRISGGAQSTHYIFRGLKKDGSIINVEIFGATIDYKGRPAAIGTILDITEQILAKEALTKQNELQRVLLSTIPACVYIKDRGSVFMAGNKNFSELVGAPESEIPGKTDYDFFPGEIAESFRRDDAEVIATGKATLNNELSVKDAEGNDIWFQTSKCPFYGPSGEIAGLVGICINTTDKKRAEEDRLQLQQRLQQVRKAESLGRMAGAIAHHFNNMLAVVIGNLELCLLDLPAESMLTPYVCEALGASERAAELSRSMLMYLGQDHGKIEPVGLSEICRGALDQIWLPDTVEVELEIPEEGPVVRADRAHIRQILANLVANAQEAMAERAGKVEVAVKVIRPSDIGEQTFYPPEWERKDASYGCISVADSGAGMDTEMMDKVFDPFFTTKFTGRGLGLAMVLGIVKAYGGAVAVKSTPGRGSVFTVLLPLSSEEIPRKVERSGSVSPEERRKVLLVEDEPEVRKMTLGMLKHLGYETIEAGDGVEALEMFRQHQGDILCVLLDITMERMDGWQTLAALRAIRHDLRVILASGHDESEAMRGTRSERPDAFLQKPYRKNDLKAALASVLRKQQW